MVKKSDFWVKIDPARVLGPFFRMRNERMVIFFCGKGVFVSKKNNIFVCLYLNKYGRRICE